MILEISVSMFLLFLYAFWKLIPETYLNICIVANQNPEYL